VTLTQNSQTPSALELQIIRTLLFLTADMFGGRVRNVMISDSFLLICKIFMKIIEKISVLNFSGKN